MRNRSIKGALAIVTVLTLVVCLGGSWVRQQSGGSAQLISIDPLPLAGETCFPEEANSYVTAGYTTKNLFAALQARTVYAAQSGNSPVTVDVNRPALRTIQDTESIYTAVAVDMQSNEVYLQENNNIRELHWIRLTKKSF